MGTTRTTSQRSHRGRRITVACQCGKLHLALLRCLLLALTTLIGTTSATPGVLEIVNTVDPPYSSSLCNVAHRPGASEGYDTYDSLYYPMFNPSGISGKIVSTIPGYELDIDHRPEESLSRVDLELSLISASGYPITIASANGLSMSMPLAQGYGYDFGTKPITLRLDNGQRYDVRVLTANGTQTAVVLLADLNGTYNSEEVYATPELHFRHVADLDNDGDVDLCDYSVLAQNWSGSGGALTGDISGPDGIPDGAVDVDDVTALVDNMTGPQ